MKAIKPILWHPNGLAKRNRHDPWLVSSMASFNHLGHASQSISRGAHRIKKWMISAVLAWTAAASIGLGCLLLTDSTPDTGTAAAPQSRHVAAAAAPGYAPARSQRD